MTGGDWIPCSELYLQGNLTIAGHAQKIWHARPSVCEINVHATSGIARIDTSETSVLVSASVIQCATLQSSALKERMASSTATQSTTTPSGLEIPLNKPLDEPTVAEPTTRADEILAEMQNEQMPMQHRRRKGAKN